MTSKFLILIAGLSILSAGCVKHASENTGSDIPRLITQAHDYFERNVLRSGQNPNPKNYRVNRPRSVRWEKATIQHLPIGDIVVAPVVYQHNLFISLSSTPNLALNLGNLSSLAMIPDSNNVLHAVLITFIPDTSSNDASPSGICFVEDWQGNSYYNPILLGRQIRQPANYSPHPSGNKQVDYYQSVQVCTEIDGYNYSPDYPDDGYYWSETSCTSYGIYMDDPVFVPQPSYIPRLAATRSLSPMEIVVAPPTFPIPSISDYLKCFTNGPSPDHSYSVQLCVDQPEPGSRQAWGFTPGGPTGSSAAHNAINTGHAFLVLTENDQGNIITRNMGFYPSTMVIPTANGASSQGALNNDQTHAYNISLTINVTGNQFFSILDYMSLGNNQGYYYNLFSNNCTTFVLKALQEGGITLPSTIGTWPGGSGNDPGDLGEDIRNMQLSPNMSRNILSAAHPNTGNCN